MLVTDSLALSPNPLVQVLGKPAEAFTRADIIRFVTEQDVPMLNLRYVGGDGRVGPRTRGSRRG